MFLKKSYYTQNLSIALPIILSFAGQAVVQIVDTVMVGRLGTAELGAVAFAGTLFSNVMVFGMGLVIGLTPLVGAAYAQKDYQSVGVFFRNSLFLNVLLAIALTLFLAMLYFFLDNMGQPREVLDYAKDYYLILLFSLFPFLLFIVFKQCLEGMGNTKMAMYITLTSVLLNIALNYMLIYGHWGAPSMGVRGAALATLIARAVMPVLFIAYLFLPKVYHRYHFLFEKTRLSKDIQYKLLAVGFPIAGQMVLEFFSLSCISIMMGWIGVVALAANQVVLSIISFTFMITNGVSGATTVLVSQAFGLRNTREIHKRARCGIDLSLTFMLGAALVLLFFGEAVAKIFTQDVAVIKLSAQLFLVVMLFELFDGLQVTALGALRGITDVQRPMVIAFFSYICVCLPCGYLCGFVLGWGPMGVLSGFMMGLIVAAILYVLRFRWSVKQLGRQWGH